MTRTQDGYLAGSVLAGLVTTIVARLRGWLAADTSTLVAGLHRSTHYVRHSFLYRWLTAEPTHDVVVIDLRETRVFGPLVALLDRVRPTVASAWEASNAKRFVDRIESKRAVFEASRSVQLLAAVLEPPDPPADRRE